MDHAGHYILVRQDLFDEIQLLIHRPEPVSGHGLLSYLLGYAYINMPHRYSERQMLSQPRGFTWENKPYKTMELLAWRPGC